MGALKIGLGHVNVKNWVHGKKLGTLKLGFGYIENRLRICQCKKLGTLKFRLGLPIFSEIWSVLNNHIQTQTQNWWEGHLRLSAELNSSNTQTYITSKETNKGTTGLDVHRITKNLWNRKKTYNKWTLFKFQPKDVRLINPWGCHRILQNRMRPSWKMNQGLLFSPLWMAHRQL